MELETNHQLPIYPTLFIHRSFMDGRGADQELMTKVQCTMTK